MSLSNSVMPDHISNLIVEFLVLSARFVSPFGNCRYQIHYWYHNSNLLLAECRGRKREIASSTRAHVFTFVAHSRADSTHRAWEACLADDNWYRICWCDARDARLALVTRLTAKSWRVELDTPETHRGPRTCLLEGRAIVMPDHISNLIVEFLVLSARFVSPFENCRYQIHYWYHK